MKEFIPLSAIAIVTILNSCSIDDGMFVDISKKEKNTTLKINERSSKSNIGSSDSSFMLIDSIMVNDTRHIDRIMDNDRQQDSQEDPPVKGGNHWIYGH